LCGGEFIRNLMALIRRVASLHDVDGKVSKTASVIDDVFNGISIQRVARACPRGVIAEFEQVPGDILRAKRARFRSLTQKRCLYFFSDKKRATVL